ncbi:hypothetical protein KNO81_41445 [Paraburkholderia sediminicola]|nr:hypothetical protein [Paraburkholderia sediminicola]
MATAVVDHASGSLVAFDFARAFLKMPGLFDGLEYGLRFRHSRSRTWLKEESAVADSAIR